MIGIFKNSAFNTLKSYNLPASRGLFIQTELTPNLDSIKFKPGSILTQVPIEFLNPQQAIKSPLAFDLFKIDGIQSVFVNNDYITITKTKDFNWQILKPDIYSAIMDFISSKAPLVSVSVKEEVNNDDSEIVSMIKELLDTRIRPTIQDDGGDVQYLGFVDGIVKVSLKGACRTCDSSTITLKNGIEAMLMHYIAEVKGVEQVDDEVDSVSSKAFTQLEIDLKKSSF